MLHVRCIGVARAGLIVSGPALRRFPIYRFYRPRDDRGLKRTNNEFNREVTMPRGTRSWVAMVALAGAMTFSSGVTAQTTAPPAENAAPTADNAVMLTIF